MAHEDQDLGLGFSEPKAIPHLIFIYVIKMLISLGSGIDMATSALFRATNVDCTFCVTWWYGRITRIFQKSCWVLLCVAIKANNQAVTVLVLIIRLANQVKFALFPSIQHIYYNCTNKLQLYAAGLINVIVWLSTTWWFRSTFWLLHQTGEILAE